MPVSAGTVQFSYVGDGTTTVFAFPSRFLSNADIIVGVNGVPVLSGFVVTGQGNETGGNVTFAVAPLNGQTVTLIRAPGISQLLDFVNNQTILAENLDNGLDKLTIIAQYLGYLLDRTLRLSQFDTAISGNFDLLGKRISNSGAPVDANDLARLADVQTVVSSGGNVPSPTVGQIGYRLQALAAGIFGWVAAGAVAAPDGSLSAPGINFGSELNTGFLRPSAGLLQTSVLGGLRTELSSTALRLLVSLLSTNGTVTGGTNAQGQGAITTDQATVTSTPNNPSGVTLPTAVAGRRVIVANRGTNPISIYPATGAQIGALAVNLPVTLAVGQVAEFFARTATQWENQINQPFDQDLTDISAVSRARGTLLRGGISAWEGLALGANGQFLRSDGTDLVYASGGYTWLTPQATTSGTTFDFTGIPTWATEVIISFSKFRQTAGSLEAQLRTGGAPVTTGYSSASTVIEGASAANLGSGTGFTVLASTAGNGLVADMLLTKWPSSNLWNQKHLGLRRGASQDGSVHGGGDLTLAGALDGVRVIVSGGTANQGNLAVGYR